MLRSGDLISGFMKRIGVADHVILVVSDKYLRSPYCMTELHYIYQRSLGEKEDFLRRIIPLVLDDARFGGWRERVAYAEHWEKEFKAMEPSVATSSNPTTSPTISFLRAKMQKWVVTQRQRLHSKPATHSFLTLGLPTPADIFRQIRGKRACGPSRCAVDLL